MSPSSYARRERRSRPASPCSDERGLTLVELLVAMLLLGIILSATASSLIQFGRTTADNERRVQATALMNRLHEEMQAVPWQDAGNYEDDLAELLADGFPGLDNSPAWTIDGEEIVTILGPGSLPRAEAVPELVTPVTIDDRDYDVTRFVTWSDEAAGIKRFTTIVRWQLYDRVYEERFFSERAATSAEAGDPALPRVVQFQMGPSPMMLDNVDPENPAQNAEDIDIVVRFSQGVDTAELVYQSLDVELDAELLLVTTSSEKTLPLTKYISEPETSRGIAFRGTLPAGFRTFAPGTQTFTVNGDVGALTATGRTSMVFVDPSTPPPSPVSVNSVTLSRTNVCQAQNNDRFRSEVIISTSIDGITPADHVVTIAYSAGGSPRSEAMIPVAPDTFGESGAIFRATFAADVDHGFRPPDKKDGERDETSFTVTATRTSTGATDQMTSTGQLAVRYGNGASC